MPQLGEDVKLTRSPDAFTGHAEDDMINAIPDTKLPQRENLFTESSAPKHVEQPGIDQFVKLEPNYSVVKYNFDDSDDTTAATDNREQVTRTPAPVQVDGIRDRLNVTAPDPVDGIRKRMANISDIHARERACQTEIGRIAIELKALLEMATGELDLTCRHAEA